MARGKLVVVAALVLVGGCGAGRRAVRRWVPRLVVDFRARRDLARTDVGPSARALDGRLQRRWELVGWARAVWSARRVRRRDPGASAPRPRVREAPAVSPIACDSRAICGWTRAARARALRRLQRGPP